MGISSKCIPFGVSNTQIFRENRKPNREVNIIGRFRLENLIIILLAKYIRA